MQTEQGVKIVARFFEALDTLIAKKVIRGKKTFTTKYGINRGSFYRLEKDKSRDILQLEWLAGLITDYNVSADWLLTGRGSMFTTEPIGRTKFENKSRLGNFRQMCLF